MRFSFPRITSPQKLVTLQLLPTSENSLDTVITFHELAPRKALKLAARSAPTPKADLSWDSGAGGQQWSKLDVSVSRKKLRCSECTRPLADDAKSSLLCDRCMAAASTVSTLPPAVFVKNSGRQLALLFCLVKFSAGMQHRSSAIST